MNQVFIQPHAHKRDTFLSPVLIYAEGKPLFFSKSGEISNLSAETTSTNIIKDPVLVCHALYTMARTNITIEQPMDILELYAFTHPTKFAVPTPKGIIKALGQTVPDDHDDVLMALLESVDHLLDDLASQSKQQTRILDLAHAMGLQGRGWIWTPFIFNALGRPYHYKAPIESKIAYNVWNHLPEWSEYNPEPQKNHHAVTGDESRERLAYILTQQHQSEQRAEQVNYVTRVTEIFRPKEHDDQPLVMLAEAGTGVGKTRGYLTPSTLWADKNQNPVWISTYTKNLQRQIDSELDQFYPDPEVKNAKVAVRKGRENYLCLLNFEDQALSAHLMTQSKAAIASGIMARWISETRDGDLSGSDFPGWLTHLLGAQFTSQLADKRGECIYAACDHYNRCFAERSIRKSYTAPIVVANHATVMIAAATESDHIANRYVFDEAHHLFHAADNVFCAHITGAEAHDLRRWIMGPEGGRKSRARGLKKRIENIIIDEDHIQTMVNDVIKSAMTLPPEQWMKQISDNGLKTNFEVMIAALFEQIKSRSDNAKSFYSEETSLYPLSDAVKDSLPKTIQDLARIQKSIHKLISECEKLLVDKMDKYNADQRRRIDILITSLQKKKKFQIDPWIKTLQSLLENSVDPQLIDWAGVEKIDGKILDIGIFRHHINPMKPFAESMKPHLHTALITSATLRDKSDSDDHLQSWQTAFETTGANILTETPAQFSIPSPFSYAEQTRVFIVSDVEKNNLEQVSSAYLNLFKTSGGGALGLFTSIQRLKSVYNHIEQDLAMNDITLFSQHIDGIDTGTLIDMFRDDMHSCLLGTDAVRDGVDIPGDSLRLIVFDRVPWPRPTILHKARRNAFGNREYDDRLTRLKLKQAFGRLIRTQNDKGVFVMLDNSMPSKLLSALPDNVIVEKIGIKDVLEKTKMFLGT